MTGGWRWTGAFYRALAAAVLPLGLGLSLGRADLVVLAAPLVLLLVLALVGRSVRPDRMAAPTASASAAGGMVTRSSVPVDVALSGTGQAEFVAVSLPASTARPTGLTRVFPAGDRHLDAPVVAKGWGSITIARPDLSAAGPDGLQSIGPDEGTPLTATVLPGIPIGKPLPLPPISGGWAGAHISRRPGQGNDLVDLRAYQPGDRIRSVHWRAYARHGTLYTRRTLSDADADLTLCLDVRVALAPRRRPIPVTWVEKAIALIVEVGRRFSDARSRRSGGPGTQERLDAEEDAGRSSLDHTVEAVSSVAQAQLRAGDRVSVMTVSSDRRSIRPGGGTRHLHRIRYFLAESTVSHRNLMPVARWNLRPNTVVVLFSPLADDAIADAAAEVAGRGHRTIVVDTLPQREIVAAARGEDLEHLQILVLQRERRIARIKGAGVPVLTWEAGQIAEALAAARYGREMRR